MRKVQVRVNGNLAEATDDLRRWLDHHHARLEDFSIRIERDGTAVISVAFADPHLADAFEADFAAANAAD